jgi:hypothetical protein
MRNTSGASGRSDPAELLDELKIGIFKLHQYLQLL